MLKVAAAVIARDGLIMAARKRAGLHLAGYWEFPGGKIEPGETPEECLRRELWEEFGVRGEIGTFLGESTYSYGHNVVNLLGYFAIHREGCSGSRTMTRSAGCRRLRSTASGGPPPISRWSTSCRKIFAAGKRPAPLQCFPPVFNPMI